MRLTSSRASLARLALAAFVATTCCAASFAVSPASGAESGSTSSSSNLFDDAVELIRENFWKEMTREEIELQALRALLAQIDPYGRYLDAGEWSELDDDLSARSAGVGVQLEMDEAAGLPRIRYLLLESAAGAAGARRDDWIVAIDGKPLAGLALGEVPPLLRGDPGTRVELTLRRAPDGPAIRAVVERKIHRLPSVHGVRREASGRAVYVLDPQLGLGYVRISHLASDSLGEVESALADLEAQGARGLVLDLRDSYGGLMSAGVGIADLFLGSGRIAGHESRTESESFEADPSVAWKHPMIVLINAGTASSSEFLAAALRDHARARFIGQRTYGKGLVQVKYELGEGQGGLILSTGRHLRPFGVAADRNDPPPANAAAGVAPDPGLEVVIEGEEYDRWSEAIDLRASPVVLDDSDLAGAPPDRALQLATELLAKLSVP